MKSRFLAVALSAAVSACSGEDAATVHAIAPNGTNDMTRALLDAIHSSDGGKVILSEGTYHFYTSSAKLMDIYISNHDQDLPRRVQLPICSVSGIKIEGEGKGAQLVFHGESTGIMLMDSDDVTLANISLDWAESPIGEAKVKSVSKENGRYDIEWVVKAFDGVGDAQMLWDAKTHAIKPGTGDIFKIDQVSAGDTISFRSWSRPSPAICLYRTKGIMLNNVVIHSAHGMGLLAQRSADISWQGGGVLPREGCLCSTKADATHFSNCKGSISVTGALFSGMMDDAINVHSTCLRIAAKPTANSIRCRYMHPQAIGFEVFKPGERLRFIRAQTLENGPVCTVSNVLMEDERTVVLTLDDDGAAALEGYDEGDAVENADWQPSVIFAGNTVKNNRARAALFTTPGKVVVIGNTFDHVSGSAILFAGDAANWYESGSCQDVTIENNMFLDCLTSRYQFCTAVIAFAPTVQDLASQKAPYHRNIKVSHNTFECPGAKIFDGISVENVIWRDNNVGMD